MIYINTEVKGEVETLDQFDTRKEARAMLEEYHMSTHGQHLYLSNRCTKEWRESQ